MLAVDQWAALEEGLDPRWEAAKLSFSAEEARAVPESAAVLAPLGPGRVGTALQFEVARLGGGPEKLRNLLGRLDDKRIWGTLELLEVSQALDAPRAAAAMALALSDGSRVTRAMSRNARPITALSSA